MYTIARPQLLEQLFDIAFDRELGQVNVGANFSVGEAIRHQAQDDALTLAERLVGVTGFDGKGNTIISVSYVNGSGQEIWIATGPTSASAIAGFTNPQFGGTQGFNSYNAPAADSHGLWFAGNYSTWGQSTVGFALYVPGSGFYWMSSIGGQLAGGCY